MMTSNVEQRITESRSGESFELFGSTLTLKVTAADTAGAYSLIEYDAPPGLHGAPMHHHEQTEEYLFVLDGHVSVVLDGEEIVAGPGEGILFPRGVDHSFANRSDDRAHFLTLLRPGGFEELLAKVAILQATEDWEPTPEEFARIIAPYDFVASDHGH